MASPDDLASWYGGRAVGGFSPKLLDDVFQQAKKKYADDFTIGSREQAIAESARGMHDVQALLRDAVLKYESKQRFPVLRDRLKRLSSKIHYYANVVDVLVQHHPEYVSLVWGAMKFLFTAVVNHEYILKSITQVIGQVADSLPRLELSYNLYANERMESAFTDLYVSLLEFFMKAREWYDESSFKRAYHSVMRPWELKFQDSFDRIGECSRRIDKLAFAGMQTEIREVRNLQQASISHIKALSDKSDWNNQQVMEKNQELMEKMSKLLDAQLSSQALHSSALVDNNSLVTESQAADMIASLSDTDSLWGCMKAYRYCRVTRNQRRNIGTLTQTRPFWLDPKLRQWTSLDSSSLVAIQGSSLSRFLMKDFMTNVIDQLRSNNVMALWLLNPIGRDNIQTPSCAEAMKQLVLQVIQQSHQPPGTERSMALTVARLECAKTSRDWASLLQSILSTRENRQIYLLVDLEAFHSQSGGVSNGISFLELLWDVCNALSQQHGADPKVKILVLSYGRIMGARMSSCTVSIQATPIPVRRRKAIRAQQVPGILGVRA